MAILYLKNLPESTIEILEAFRRVHGFKSKKDAFSMAMFRLLKLNPELEDSLKRVREEKTNDSH